MATKKTAAKAPAKAAPKAAAKVAVKPVAKVPAKAPAKAAAKPAPKPVAKAPAKPAAKPVASKSSDVLFQSYSPDSQSVAVAADFNSWNPAKGAMKKGKDGVWSLKIKLAPGSYQYKLVYDEQYWEADNSNPERVADGQGGENSIKHV